MQHMLGLTKESRTIDSLSKIIQSGRW